MSYLMWGNDAGTANYGYTVMPFSKKGFEFSEIGQILSTFKNLNHEEFRRDPTKAQKTAAFKKGIKLTKKDMPAIPAFQDTYPKFYGVLDEISTTYKFTHAVIERFQTRGNGGPLIEMVGIQLGTMAALAHQRKFQLRLITAGVWKNALNKVSNLEDVYEYAKQFGLTPHECDSTGMSLYQASILGILPLEKSLPYWRKAISEWAKKQ